MNNDTAHENLSPLATGSAEPLAGMTAEETTQSRACSAEPRCPRCNSTNYKINSVGIKACECGNWFLGTGREPAGRAARPNAGDQPRPERRITMSETYSHETLRDAYECGRRDALASCASEGATSESTGPAKVVAAVPTGSLPGLSAEALALVGAKRAFASIGRDKAPQGSYSRGYYAATSDIYEELENALHELRRQAGLPNLRQPEENK